MTAPRILAFAGALRTQSWNKKLIRIGANVARDADAEVDLIDLRDYPMPFYDGDTEAADGLPEKARALKALMLAVEACALRVVGRLEPGLPKSVIQGGRWAGVDVISKSGAFGPPELWFSLLRQNRLM